MTYEDRISSELSLIDSLTARANYLSSLKSIRVCDRIMCLEEEILEAKMRIRYYESILRLRRP